MANSSFFGYSYFSGANVFIKLNGIPALETAGITYSVQESTAPIYGYSSRIFDAVAMGQKMIRGSFVINFIAPNYIARIIELGRAGLNVENVRQTYTKSDFNEEVGVVENKLKEALQAQKDLELQYKQAQQTLLKELNPAIQELEGNENALIEQMDAVTALRINAAAEQMKIMDNFHKRAGQGGALIGYDTSLSGVDALLQEKTAKELLEKNSELRNKSIDELNRKSKTLEKEYLKRAKEIFEKVKSLEREIDNKKIDLDLDYEAVALSQGTSVVNLRRELEGMEDRLKDENRSLVQKEIDSRRTLNNQLNQLKNAKNFNSVQEAIAGMNALEKVNSSYYSNSQEMQLHGVNNTNDIGLLGPFNIDIQFAEEYTIRIIDAFLTSRGSMIQIDENAIVEEYSFFARDIKYF